MPSASNERQKKAREDKARRDRINDELITRQLMSTSEGRRWMNNRLEEARIFDEDMEFDPGYMAYRKGERNWGLRLLKDAQGFCPSEYVTMMEEATSIKIHINPPQDESDDYE